MAASELRDGAKVGRLQRHDCHEIHPLHARLGDPARGVEADRITIKQQCHHHGWMIGRLPLLALVARHNRRRGTLSRLEPTSRPPQTGAAWKAPGGDKPWKTRRILRRSLGRQATCWLATSSTLTPPILSKGSRNSHRNTAPSTSSTFPSSALGL